jgi:hypothetical protein
MAFVNNAEIRHAVGHFAVDNSDGFVVRIRNESTQAFLFTAWRWRRIGERWNDCDAQITPPLEAPQELPGVIVLDAGEFRAIEKMLASRAANNCLPVSIDAVVSGEAESWQRPFFKSLMPAPK